VETITLAIGHLLKYDPTAKVIVSSGYSDESITSDYQQFGFKGVVSKPYKMEELLDTIKRLKNAPAPYPDNKEFNQDLTKSHAQPKDVSQFFELEMEMEHHNGNNNPNRKPPLPS